MKPTKFNFKDGLMLPLIPLAIGAASLLSAAFGGRQMLQAHEHNKTVKDIIKRLKERGESVDSGLKDAFERLSKRSLEGVLTASYFLRDFKLLYEDAVSRDGDLLAIVDEGFPSVLAKLNGEIEQSKNIDLGDNQRVGDLPFARDGSSNSLMEGLKEFCSAVGNIHKVYKYTPIAASALVGYFGTASTGTAIASLSGAAATNATLAWFGGGSLASGGLGMAGGTAVLGMAAVGPAALVAGLALSKHCKNKFDAAVRAEKEMEELEEGTRMLNRYVKILDVVVPAYEKKVNKLSEIIKSNGQNYDRYSEEEIFVVKKCMEFSTVIAEICSNKVFTISSEGYRTALLQIAESDQKENRLFELNHGAYRVIDRHSAYL